MSNCVLLLKIYFDNCVGYLKLRYIAQKMTFIRYVQSPYLLHPGSSVKKLHPT